MNFQNKNNQFWPFSNSYLSLPNVFFEILKPEKIKNPKLIKYNKLLSQELNFNIEDTNLIKDLFSGNYIPDKAKTIALAYSGHQFGNFVPNLGDGRAILLGELAKQDGTLVDVQLKGSGKTKFSRNGDGKAPLGPVIREYIISEAMNALSIPTTRSLAIVSTGEKVFREKTLPGGILTRSASSHLRVGTFQFCQILNDQNKLKKLCDFTINRHFPHIKNKKNPYLELLIEVQENQTYLISRWMSAGFIHGVMNTDNTSISGETIDFGPCAFMDEYNPSTVFSSIDFNGRYSFSNQPGIAQWNIARFAESILPLINDDEKIAISQANEIINEYPKIFKQKWLDIMGKKIGIEKIQTSDEILINNLLNIMSKNHLDFTITFRNLCDKYITNENNNSEINNWKNEWFERINKQGLEFKTISTNMKKINPLYIPRNHLVEKVINEAINNENYQPLEDILEVINNPYSKKIDDIFYTATPNPDERVYQTFCGT
ncbi:MAG: hypothetical protein CMM49_10315 [Rhodospirillaceae bacterium]|nr:hypothetical protein [Rhodospirillaceae bacterium]|tara:strand:- start:2934 stop:4397 length:1464 start_codon:yes stop_codon:yes gene_type:complete